jgi:nucleoside-diphosphate-sugar epimerase
MHKVGIIGANGQVGAELSLLLASQPHIELIPICRNRSGSAFLRWQGLACRHGRVADASDAPRLLSDCDVIINSSLASGTPANIRRVEDQIIHNTLAYSKESATIIHFSTQSVYGDPRQDRWIRWKNPYGRAKFATEQRLLREARRSGKRVFILRLGHVCGAMQDISNHIRETIRGNMVVLPSQDRSSNTVYTAAIAGAIDQIIRGAATPGTYDLMNTPRWTWRQVYEYEARDGQAPLTAHIIDQAQAKRHFSVAVGAARLASSLAVLQPVRNLVAKIFAYAPPALNARAMAWWYVRRARSEIAGLATAYELPEHLSWVENGERFFPADRHTIELLRSVSDSSTVQVKRKPWPDDLPDAPAIPQPFTRRVTSL